MNNGKQTIQAFVWDSFNSTPQREKAQEVSKDRSEPILHDCYRTMNILSKKSGIVKEIRAGEFSPGGEDRAMLESNLSAPLGPSGESSPDSISRPEIVWKFDTPDGLKAINSPANDVYSPKPANNNTLDVSPSSSPASVGLSTRYVNSDTPEIIGIVTAFREHCDKLEHSPCTFLHLQHKQDKSTALFRVNASSASRYFQQGRAHMIKNIRPRLSTQRKRGVFFTLTVDAKKHSLTDAWTSMWPNYNRFKDALNMYRKRHMNASHSFRYLAALEPHKSGFPHLHVYCPELRWLIKKPDLPKMDEWWAMGSANTEKELRRDCASNYITKYISKMDGWSEVSLAMIWRYRIRIYNLSHKYRDGKPESDWILLRKYTNSKGLAKGLDMTIKDAEKLLQAIADMDENLVYLTIPEDTS